MARRSRPLTTRAIVRPVFTQIRLRGLGVIDDAVLEPCPGLTVVTGETGAGKTMVVSGLALLFGGRADSSLVRVGARSAAAEGVLALGSEHPAALRATEAGGDLAAGTSEQSGDSELILARIVSAEGRSRAVVGGRTVPVSVLAEIGESVLAVHGQADQYRLRSAAAQRHVLDSYGAPLTTSALAATEAAFDRHEQLRAEADRLATLATASRREIEMLRAALEHIDGVAPTPGEDASLRVEEDRLGHADSLGMHAAAAHEGLAGADEGPDRPSVLSLLAGVRSDVAAVVEHDPSQAELATRTADVVALVADLAADLAGYSSAVEVDPARLAWVQQRRADLSALVRRYGEGQDGAEPTIEDVLVFADQSARRVLEVDGSAERAVAVSALADQAKLDLDARNLELTRARRQAAERLADAVSAELADLAMGRTRLHVEVSARDAVARHGADEVQLMLSGPDSVPRPLARAASGGELSRVMLAIEVVCGVGGLTLVFDEVDAGVGGAAAVAVGARLARLARHTQVIVVTHLPQVAAFADRHLVVRKDATGAVTTSTVVQVSGPDRQGELARMMSGDLDSPTGRALAAELLAEAGQRIASSAS